MSQRVVHGPVPDRPHGTPSCQACMDPILRADSFVSVYPSWERHHHYLHARCWTELMMLAQAALLKQLELPNSAN